MTMVPAHSFSQHQKQQQQQQQQHLCYGGYCGGGGGGSGFKESFGLMSRLEVYDSSCLSEACLLGSDLVLVADNNNPMAAEDESRTNSLNNNEDGSSSKDGQEGRDHEGWLQLSIGGHTAPTTTTTTTSYERQHDHLQQQQQQQQQQQLLDTTARSRGGLVELDLLPGSSSSISHQARNLSTTAPVFHLPDFRAPPAARPAAMNIINAASPTTNFSTASLFFHHHPAATSSTYPLHHQEINWAFRPMTLHNIAAAATTTTTTSPSPSSSSSSLMPLMGSYFSRPFHVHTAGMDVAGPSSEFRVIDPPRRTHSGIWFMLQASQNQAKEPFLPQLSKSYLRIKDGRMTVRLLMKYLVNKLRLDNESEIEITCRGQQLPPFFTLQHVRDNIWSPRDALPLLPESSTTDHVMVLHYGRSG